MQLIHFRQPRGWLMRLFSFFNRKRREREFAEELESHLAMHIEDNLRAGMSPEEARRVALVKLGGVTLIHELYREQRELPMLETFWQDIRFGLRMLRKNPGFTLVAALTLSLGIGANTALFSLVDAVLLKTLPVERPEDLVSFKWIMGPNGVVRLIGGGTAKKDPVTGLTQGTPFSYPAFAQFRAQSQTLSAVFAFVGVSLNVNLGSQAEVVSGQLVTGDFYSGLGVQAVAGRMITADDDHLAASPVAVMSYRFWERRFGLDQAAIGKTIQVNGSPCTIIGVTPPAFYGGLEFGAAPDLTVPMTPLTIGQSRMTDATEWWLDVMGRIKPGVQEAAVRAELESAYQQDALAGWKALPPTIRGPDNGRPPDLPKLQFTSGSQGLTNVREAYRQPMTIIMVVVAMVLLLACANVANLLLARATTRRQEIAVRLALGARRFRLLRQLLTEGLLLAAVAAALGWGLAWWAKGLLLKWNPKGGAGLDADLSLNWRVFGFTLGVTLLASLLFGLAPALQATRADLQGALKQDGLRGGTSLSRLSRSLVIAQIAVSLVLLVGTGLFVRTLRNLQAVSLGFNPQNVLLFSLDTRAKSYPKEQLSTLYERVIERIAALPGVQSATISEVPLLSRGEISGPAFAPGRPPSPESERIIYQQNVRWNYFQTMEIPLLAGRALSAQDDARAPKVAVISRTLARKFFGDENPLGQRLAFNPQQPEEYEIVGVVGDTKYTRQRQETPAVAYFAYPQRSFRGTVFSVRTSSEATQAVSAIRAAVRQVEPNWPLTRIKTQSQQADEALSQERFLARLVGLFGALALLLASIGLYGVMSYAVTQRTPELAIRLALGATPAGLLRQVLRQGLWLTLIGLAIGATTALIIARLISHPSFELTRFLSSLLFGVSPTDPLTFIVIAGLLLGIALLACWIPARRATKVDPLIALRTE
jgi:predicted permease